MSPGSCTSCLALTSSAATKTAEWWSTRGPARFTMPGVLHSAGKPIHTFENTGPDDLIVIGVEHKPLVAAG